MPWRLETTHSSMKVCILRLLDEKLAFSIRARLSLLLRVPGPWLHIRIYWSVKKNTHVNAPPSGSPTQHKWGRPWHQHFKAYQRCFGAVRGENHWPSAVPKPACSSPSALSASSSSKMGHLSCVQRASQGFYFFHGGPCIGLCCGPRGALKSTERSKFLKDSHFISNLLTEHAVCTEHSIVCVFSLFLF